MTATCRAEGRGGDKTAQPRHVLLQGAISPAAGLWGLRAEFWTIHGTVLPISAHRRSTLMHTRAPLAYSDRSSVARAFGPEARVLFLPGLAASPCHDLSWRDSQRVQFAPMIAVPIA